MKKLLSVYLIIGFTSVILSGCTPTPTSITAFRDHYEHLNYYALGETATEELRWGNCFVITEEEVEIAINEVYSYCLDIELQKMPDTISRSEELTFRDSVDKCAKLKFLYKYKDKFTFDKSPQHLDQCKKIHSDLKTHIF